MGGQYHHIAWWGFTEKVLFAMEVLNGAITVVADKSDKVFSDLVDSH